MPLYDPSVRKYDLTPAERAAAQRRQYEALKALRSPNGNIDRSDVGPGSDFAHASWMWGLGHRIDHTRDPNSAAFIDDSIRLRARNDQISVSSKRKSKRKPK